MLLSICFFLLLGGNYGKTTTCSDPALSWRTVCPIFHKDKPPVFGLFCA